MKQIKPKEICLICDNLYECDRQIKSEPCLDAEILVSKAPFTSTERLILESWVAAKPNGEDKSPRTYYKVLDVMAKKGVEVSYRQIQRIAKKFELR